MNNKLIVLCGISGSGKSTFAREYIKAHPKTVRVNRDDMRKQILGELTQDYYSKDNSKNRSALEKHITVLQNEQIRYWLLEGYDVIADNTHLRKDDCNNYVRNFGYLADIYIKPLSIELAEAQLRVSNREGLGTDLQYIDRQIKDYESLQVSKYQYFDNPIGILVSKKETPIVQYDPSKPDCIICDIDGTIADCTGIRSPYDGEKLHLDRPIEATRRLLWFTQQDDCEKIPKIIYISGREDKWEQATKTWIIKNKFPHPYEIYMRKTGDMRSDTIVKREIYEECIKGAYNVLFCIDDRKSVQRMWVDELGLFVLDVNQKDRIF